MKNIKVGFKGKKILVSAEQVWIPQISFGLMFRTKNTPNLLFDFPGNWALTSSFVFFPFLALWLDEKNKVMEWKIIRPFRFCVKPRKRFSKLVEIPINRKNKRLIQNFINTESI